MSEENMPQEQVSKPEPFDADWYARFEQVGSFQAYEYLDGDAETRKQQKEKFEKGEIENPTLDYPKLKQEDLKTKEEGLLKLKSDVLARSTEGMADARKMEVVKQAYQWRLNEKIAEVRMLKAAATGDMKRFARYSKFIYGNPTVDIFSYTVDSLRETAGKHLNSDNVDLRKAAVDLQALLPTDLPKATAATLPDTELVTRSQEKTLEQLGHIINVLESEGEVDSTVIQQAFEGALGQLRIDGWKVVTNPNKTAISVDQELKAVNVPADRRMNPKVLKGLILHEIGTHVARRQNGERTNLKLLGLGLDRYEGGEEGVATMREQALEGKVSDFAGLDGYLAISLAKGLDGKPRDFRQVYDILQKHFLVEELVAGKDSEAAEQTAKKYAWNRCVRTFRGSDCKTPGAAFTKDLIYREGNIGVWNVIRTNPNEMTRFNVGKYDPANAKHLWVLTELGITEDNLESLEE